MYSTSVSKSFLNEFGSSNQVESMQSKDIVGHRRANSTLLGLVDGSSKVMSTRTNQADQNKQLQSQIEKLTDMVASLQAKLSPVKRS